MIEWILALVLIIYAFYKYATYHNNYFQKNRVPHLKPSFLIGNSMLLLSNKNSLYDVQSIIYNHCPSAKIVGAFDFRKPFIVLRDPNVIRQLAVKDFDYFQDRHNFVDEKIDKLLGNSILMSSGTKWRELRGTLSPLFTSSKIKQMFSLITEIVDSTMDHFLAETNSDGRIEVEMKDVFSRYTNDVIASTAFGIKVNSFENTNNEFYKAGTSFGEMTGIKFLLKFISLQISPLIMRTLNIEFMDEKYSKFFRSMVMNTMATREKEGIFRPDMMNTLMQVKKGNLISDPISQEDISLDGYATVQESALGKKQIKRSWSDDDIVAQCYIFFLAGFDTTSSFLSFLSQELALYPEEQQKLYEEIIETQKMLNGKLLDYDTLHKMKYFDMVISEGLRLWPAAPFCDRVCVKDYLYNDGDLKFTIKKGVFFWIPLYAVQRDPKYFPDPNKFDPERFNDDNKKNIIPGTYMPFGVGPRNCIGSRFASMVSKAIVYHLILNYKLEPYEKTQVPLKLGRSGLTITTEKGVNLIMARRNI